MQQQTLSNWKDAEFQPTRKRELTEQQKHSLAKVVVLAAAELATYGSRRPRTCAWRPSGLQSRAWATYSRSAAPEPLRGSAKDAGFATF